MIQLTWGKKQIDEALLQIYLDRLEQRSSCCGDDFVILMPEDIYIHIKEEGINARFTTLSGSTVAPPNMLWVKVEKPTVFSLKAQQEDKS